MPEPHRPPMYYDRTRLRDLTDLVDCYSNAEFESPFRSTVPLLSLIRDGRAVLQELLTQCGLAANAALHFEFQVPPPKGKGKPSHTDLMICAASGCMAIEAKWTERPYQTVGDWLKTSSVPGSEGEGNRRKVLSGWSSLLQRMATRPITLDDLVNLTYQTVHRAASACYVGTAPQLSYFQFVAPSRGDASMRDKRLTDLRLLDSALGNGNCFPLRLIEIDIQPTPQFDELANLPKGPQTASKVKGALISVKLFAFDRMRIYEVR